jgi:hypothetical protein
VTRWDSPLTEARPPARPQGIDWLCAAVWILPLVCFWGAVALLLYAIGVL